MSRSLYLLIATTFSLQPLAGIPKVMSGKTHVDLMQFFCMRNVNLAKPYNVRPLGL